MNITLILQARMNSSRFPGKVLKIIENKTMLEHIIERINNCKNITNIIVATTINNLDDNIAKICDKNNIKYYRGSEDNVLDRFYQTALISNSDIIIRITCDCLLIDHNIIDDMINNFLNLNIKYYNMKYYNGNYSFPDGFDCEIFTFDVLKEAKQNCINLEELEHVTPYMINKYSGNSYEIKLYKNYLNLDFNKIHLSLDSEDDYILLKKIFNNLYIKNKDFDIYDVLEYLNNNSEILNNIIYDTYDNNYNVCYGKGQQLYIEAKKIIPGGTQLLSKRPEMFLPDLWPAYYQKASGIEITTLDGIKMKDFSIMGIGACILGYCDQDVNSAVKISLDKGNMTSLNSTNEVELTRLLLEIHPWADMARYCRGGGEATTIAIRISRAASKKDKVAFCGYHGWHDWYLSANWNNSDALGEHLLTGLSPNGVPKNLKNTAFPFKYNDLDGLLKILENHDIGTIIMEPQRSEEPKDNFLHKIRKLCDERNIILVFDEVSSGFRLNSGGIHLLYDVNPDIAIFAKAMGNGYPIGAIIGKTTIMSVAEETFISSTYWTEDIGFTAAIATIKKHIECNVGNHIKELGMYFQKEIKKIAENTNIKLSVSGLPCFSTFTFEYENSMAIKTLYIQEMLKKNILAKNALYMSYAHKKSDIDFYLENIKDVFIILNETIEKNKVEESLLGPVVHTGFKRLA